MTSTELAPLFQELIDYDSKQTAKGSQTVQHQKGACRPCGSSDTSITRPDRYRVVSFHCRACGHRAHWKVGR